VAFSRRLNMELLLQREPSTLNSTPGTLSIDGAFECFTLEDVVREVPGKPASTWKIANQTAIPVGTYQVIIDFSTRFQRQMPHILNVPGFDGIRIHSGNTAADTDGCILLGKARNGLDDVIESRDVFDNFFPKLQDAINQGEQVRIIVAAARPFAETKTA
jgi:Steigviridae/Suoliviridae L,D-carboxypeptidase/transpeptidase